MVKCLNKYGLKFETVNPSNEVQKKLPLWHHPGANSQKRQENNGERPSCLRRNHAVMTVGDALDLIQRLDDPLHYKRMTCLCDACDADKEQGCENPHACVTTAASRLGQILPRWIPDAGRVGETAPDNTSETGGSKRFEPPESITSLAQGLRVMTRRSDEPKERQAPPLRRRTTVEPTPGAVEIYIAGRVHTPSGKKARAAAGVFIRVNDGRNLGKCIPAAAEQSQYAAELYA
ncbi:hypothetical protein C8J57DRAFT_1034029, partial [Mycena rebaudengoi]